MRAWLLNQIGNIDTTRLPLHWAELPIPIPKADEVLLKVSCCGVCHTELDEIEGRTPPPVLPIVPGHQVIGTVVATGEGVRQLHNGDRVGVAWIFSACGACEFCLNGNENLCPEFRATGRDAHGGYAEYMVVGEKFAYPIPDSFSDTAAAPLLCAGAIGYRSLQLTNLSDGQTLGLAGFGASAHLVLKMAKARFPNSRVLVFARSREEQHFACSLGATWAGGIAHHPPEKANAIIDTTPAWKPVLASLNNLLPGGRLVINAIRKEEADKSEWLKLNYGEHLWMEKEIKSVANITSREVREFLKLAAGMNIQSQVEIYPMTCANEALIDLKQKHVRGAKVLQWSTPE
jgi:propanol-preferring alcohol dehydrogenase